MLTIDTAVYSDAAEPLFRRVVSHETGIARVMFLSAACR